MRRHDTQATEQFWRTTDNNLYNDEDQLDAEDLEETAPQDNEQEPHYESGNEAVRPMQDSATDRDE